MKKNFIFLLLFFTSITAHYSQSRSDDCRSALMEVLNIPQALADRFEDPCYALAADIQGRFIQSRSRLSDADQSRSSIGFDLSPRDLQSNKSNHASTVAALNQADAIPSLYPFALGGGSISGTGSEAGTNALTAISINPAIFFADMDDTDESAKWGRLMDFTAILPLNGISAIDSQKLQYVGLRGRINFTGAEKGSQLYENVRTQFAIILNSSAVETEMLKEILMNAADCESCARQLLKVSEGNADVSTIHTFCGSTFTIDEQDEQFATFKKVLDKLVDEADKKYFGLDLRGDFGDPTLGAIENARGTSIFTGLGYGFTTHTSDQKKGGKTFHSRIGIRYKAMENIDATIFDIDGGVGLELSWPYQFQQIKLGFGLEGRTSLSEDINEPFIDELSEAFETDYLYFRTSLNVPITQSNGIAVQYGTSIVGDKSPILSVNFSWNLLLED